jgi:hypothetical protein
MCKGIGASQNKVEREGLHQAGDMRRASAARLPLLSGAPRQGVQGDAKQAGWAVT